MARYLRLPNSFTIVATQGTALLGFLIVQLQSGQQTGAYLVTLDVHPNFRRLGLAGRLVAEAEATSATSGAFLMELHVWTENDAAIKFYERRGFARTDVLAGYYGHGSDALFLSKRLPGRQ